MDPVLLEQMTQRSRISACGLGHGEDLHGLCGGLYGQYGYLLRVYHLNKVE